MAPKLSKQQIEERWEKLELAHLQNFVIPSLHLEIDLLWGIIEAHRKELAKLRENKHDDD